MPTGYTWKIRDGEIKNGKDFILLCARAFGACIDMREESLDAKIPDEFKPNTYHKEQLIKAQNDLIKFKNMSIEEVQKIVNQEHVEVVEYNKKYYKELLEIKSKYLNILADVYSWQEATEEHKELKKYSIQQIEDSIKWDCGHMDDYLKPVEKESAKSWLKRQIDKCQKDIVYYTEKQKEENERVAGRNKWIRELKDSLKNLI